MICYIWLIFANLNLYPLRIINVNWKLVSHYGISNTAHYGKTARCSKTFSQDEIYSKIPQRVISCTVLYDLHLTTSILEFGDFFELMINECLFAIHVGNLKIITLIGQDSRIRWRKYPKTDQFQLKRTNFNKSCSVLETHPFWFELFRPS